MQALIIVVDVQNDFCPGGALPARDGDVARAKADMAAAGAKLVNSEEVARG